MLEHPFGFGLQISSAAEFFGVQGLLGGVFSLIISPCPSLCLMGCLERIPDVFGMDVEHETVVPTRLFIPSQPQKLASLVFELPGWPQKPLTNQEDRFWQSFLEVLTQQGYV